MTDLETFRGRVYWVPTAPIVELQCAHCHVIADDTEPGMSREAVTTLRGRMRACGWVVAEPDGDDPRAWRDASDYCSDACARGEGPTALEIADANRCDACRLWGWARACSETCAGCGGTGTDPEAARAARGRG